VYDLAANGALCGATAYGNYQVQFLTGVPIAAWSTYSLSVNMGFVAAIGGGNAGYQLELGTSSSGVFTPLASKSGTVVYAGNLSSGTVSGSAQVVLVTGGTVSGAQLAVRWRQTATAGTSDYFGLDDVVLTVTH
jgi:hypothetical protein